MSSASVQKEAREEARRERTIFTKRREQKKTETDPRQAAPKAHKGKRSVCGKSDLFVSHWDNWRAGRLVRLRHAVLVPVELAQ